MINKDQVVGQTFISGPLAMTDIHNGGTIFGIVYYQQLAFISDTEVEMTNKVTFNRGMKDWQHSKENETWIGFYKADVDGKHIACELSYKNMNKKLFVDFIDDNTLFCEAYFMEEFDGKSSVFTKL